MLPLELVFVLRGKDVKNLIVLTLCCTGVGALTLIKLFSHILQSPKDSCEELSVTSPADIYSQFASKKELKSILRKPSAEEKDKKNFEEETSVTTQQFPSDIGKDNTQIADFDSQKVSWINWSSWEGVNSLDLTS